MGTVRGLALVQLVLVGAVLALVFHHGHGVGLLHVHHESESGCMLCIAAAGVVLPALVALERPAPLRPHAFLPQALFFSQAPLYGPVPGRAPPIAS